jgi:hypothetical protein
MLWQWTRPQPALFDDGEFAGEGSGWLGECSRNDICLLGGCEVMPQPVEYDARVRGGKPITVDVIAEIAIGCEEKDALRYRSCENWRIQGTRRLDSYRLDDMSVLAQAFNDESLHVLVGQDPHSAPPAVEAAGA